MSHFMIDGRPCAKTDGHPGKCCSVEAYEKGKATSAERRRARRAIDLEFREREREYAREYRATPAARERHNERKRVLWATDPEHRMHVVSSRYLRRLRARITSKRAQIALLEKELGA